MNIPHDCALPSLSDLEESIATPRLTEADFLCHQVAVIAAYVERFPSEEWDWRALAWVEANAGRYRQQWLAACRT